MSQSLVALKELFSAHEKVTMNVRKEHHDNIDKYNNKWDELQQTKKEKEYKSLKKELLALIDKIIQVNDELDTLRGQWYATGKDLEKALDAEAQVRETDLKLIRQDAEATEKLNEKIRKYNQEKQPKPPLELAEPIVVSTDPVADVKSFASEVFFWLKFMEDKEKNLEPRKKDLNGAKKRLQAHKM